MKEFLLTFVIQLAASYFATVGFSLIFQIPRKYLLVSGIPGALGYIAFFLLKPVIGLSLSFLVGAMVLTLAARILAVILLCPYTVFLISGIVPLVPGSGLFLTVFYFLRGDYAASGTKGVETILTLGAILLGIVIISAIPQKVLNVLKRKEKPC